MNEDKFLLEMKSITKNFPGVRALDKVNFTLRKGEVHCLVGENGAGKSTLIKILSGAYKPDSGTILIGGNTVTMSDPHQAHEMNIITLYQELELVPLLSVAENIFLGKEPCTLTGSIDRHRLYEKSKELLSSLGVNINVQIPVKNLSVAYRQLVCIAKAFSFEIRVLIMDEPSASLSSKELYLLFEVINKLKKKGVGIIYISHRLEEVLQIGDRVTILRDGRGIRTMDIKDADLDNIVKLMVGRKIENYFLKTNMPSEDEIMLVRGLEKKGQFYNINFRLRKGEILGFAGLVGAGRSEIARSLIGANHIDKGKVYLNGERINPKSPEVALELGIGLVPEDRKKDGLVLCRTVQDNVSYTILKEVSTFSFISFRKLKRVVKGFVEALDIKTPSLRHRVESLSGGNQQKVVLAKWLAARCKVLILDEPTVGIDVGAKAEFYRLMNQMAEKGLAIIFISSEIPEIINMCDRILVFSEGQITREFLSQESTQEEILKYAIPKSLKEDGGKQ